MYFQIKIILKDNIYHFLILIFQNTKDSFVECLQLALEVPIQRRGRPWSKDRNNLDKSILFNSNQNLKSSYLTKQVGLCLRES
jgi:hypothetical protein